MPHHLALLRQEYGQTIEEQAEALGLDVEAWSRLALCRMRACALDLERFTNPFEVL